jgi:hypothetical protein
MLLQVGAMEDFETITAVFDKKRWPWVLGAEDFINSIRERFFEQKADEEVPQSKELAPEPSHIKRAVCRSYRINEAELLVSRRGGFQRAEECGDLPDASGAGGPFATNCRTV